MKNYYMITRIFVVMFICLVSISCSEEGTGIAQVGITNFRFRSFVIDPMELEISINGLVVETGVVSDRNFAVKYKSDTMIVKVRDIVNNRVLYDSIYKLNPFDGRSPFVSIFSMHQPKSGASPVYVCPPPDEPLAAPGYTKMSIGYNYPPFPDTVKMIVRTSLRNAGSTISTVDSLLVFNNHFSDFFNAPRTTATASGELTIEFFTHDNARTFLGNVGFISQYSNTAYNMFFVESATSRNGVVEFNMAKVY